MKQKILLFLFLQAFTQLLPAQHRKITGTFAQQSNSELVLSGFNGFEQTEMAKTFADSQGNFTLKYPGDYRGMGYLKAKDGRGLILILNEPEVQLSSNSIENIDSLQFENSYENKNMYEFVLKNGARENALGAWKFLQMLYRQIPHLQKRNKTSTINNEIKSLEKESRDFIAGLDSGSYARWYLPIRKLIQDMPVSVQRYPDRIEQHIADFRQTDLKDKHLYHSGILDDLLEGHFMLLQSMGQPADTVKKEMNKSIDYIIANVSNGENELLDKVGRFLLHQFEKRNLVDASEHLSMGILLLSSCTISEDLEKKFEQYRSMKEGNTAPDIEFLLDPLFFREQKKENGGRFKHAALLSEVESKYKLVVFGASWCKKCSEELPKLKEIYPELQLKNTEVIFISTDTEQGKHEEFTKNFPWINYCDYNKWESKPVTDYYVFATPSMFLLDENLTIIKKPLSVAQVGAMLKYGYFK